MSLSSRQDYKIPHIAGTACYSEGPAEKPALQYLSEGDHVYFVHSYYASDCGDAVIATTDTARN
jgi:glutamine amidotransferase